MAAQPPPGKDKKKAPPPPPPEPEDDDEESERPVDAADFDEEVDLKDEDEDPLAAADSKPGKKVAPVEELEEAEPMEEAEPIEEAEPLEEAIEIAEPVELTDEEADRPTPPPASKPAAAAAPAPPKPAAPKAIPTPEPEKPASLPVAEKPAKAKTAIEPAVPKELTAKSAAKPQTKLSTARTAVVPAQSPGKAAAPELIPEPQALPLPSQDGKGIPLPTREPKAPAAKQAAPVFEKDDDLDLNEGDEESDDVIVPAAPAKPAGQQVAYVTIIDSEGNETVFALDRAVTTFGRDENCSVVIPDKKSSRKHFVIEMAGDYYNAIDTGSTNGIRIKGIRIPQRRLREGDEIVIGGFRIVYHGPTDESEPDDLVAAEAPAPAAAAPAVPAHTEEEEEEPAEDDVAAAAAPATPRKKGKAGRPAPVEESGDCPECTTPLPENGPCPQCGYKTMKLRAQENFVDKIARGDSILGNLGLWKLKRQKVLDQVFAMKKIHWIQEVVCDKCQQPHRTINEFRVRCIKCPGCGEELAIPGDNPPKLD